MFVRVGVCVFFFTLKIMRGISGDINCSSKRGQKNLTVKQNFEWNITRLCIRSSGFSYTLFIPLLFSYHHCTGREEVTPDFIRWKKRKSIFFFFQNCSENSSFYPFWEFKKKRKNETSIIRGTLSSSFASIICRLRKENMKRF